MSLASSAGYLPKYPQFSVDPVGPMGPRSYSSQGMYDHPSATETESYRSRSPPIDEARESVMPQMNYPGSSPGTTSPARVDSPLTRSPVSPGRPIRPSQSNPISPMEGTMYQTLSADSPPALR